jgi:hypothetical protein
MPVNLIAALLTMAVTISPLDSTVLENGSTISPKTPVSTVAAIGRLRIIGQRRSDQANEYLSISSLTIRELPCGPTSSMSSGMSMDGARPNNSAMKKRVNNVVEDRIDKLGHMLSEIGGLAAEDAGGDPDGLYLYVEVGDRWISSSLFKDNGDSIQYFDVSSELSDLIYEFWQAEDRDKRWAVMEYETKGTKFDAKFKYPEEVDVESFDDDRREIALKKRYGDKPIIYPPWPGQPTE